MSQWFRYRDEDTGKLVLRKKKTYRLDKGAANRMLSHAFGSVAVSVKPDSYTLKKNQEESLKYKERMEEISKKLREESKK